MRDRLTWDERSDIAMVPCMLAGTYGISGFAATSSIGPTLRSTELVGPYFDHVGNVLWSPHLTLATIAVSACAEKVVPLATRVQRMAAAGLVGFAISLAANAVSDTEAGFDAIGQHIFGGDDGRFKTVDGEDIAWGVVSTVLLSMTTANHRHNILLREPPKRLKKKKR